MTSAVGPAIKHFPQQHRASMAPLRRHYREDIAQMREQTSCCRRCQPACITALLVFARAKVHPLIMLINRGRVFRSNFGRAVAGNVQQARVRMRDQQAALFNAIAEDHCVQSHDHSPKYCTLSAEDELRWYQPACAGVVATALTNCRLSAGCLTYRKSAGPNEMHSHVVGLLRDLPCTTHS